MPSKVHDNNESSKERGALLTRLAVIYALFHLTAAPSFGSI